MFTKNNSKESTATTNQSQALADKDAEIEELKKQLADLKQVVKEIIPENEKLTEEQRILADTNTELKSQLEAKNGIIKHLSEEQKELAEKTALVSSQNEVLRNKRKKAPVKVWSAGEMPEVKVVAELADTKKTLSNQASDIGLKDKRIEELTSQNATEQGKVQDLTKKLQETEASLSIAEKAVKPYKDRVESVTEDLREADAKLKNQDARIKKLEGELNNNKAALERGAHLQAQNDGLQEQISVKDKLLIDQTDRIKSQFNQIHDKERVITERNNEIRNLKSEHKTEIDALQTQVNEQKELLSANQVNLAAAEASVKNYKKINNQIKTGLSAVGMLAGIGMIIAGALLAPVGIGIGLIAAGAATLIVSSIKPSIEANKIIEPKFANIFQEFFTNKGKTSEAEPVLTV